MFASVNNETRHDAGPETAGNSGDTNIGEHEATWARAKNVKQTSRGGRTKNDAKWWAARLFKAVSDRGTPSPFYSIKIQFRGRRTTFSLHTSNKDAAARRALAIYNDLVDKGWDHVIAERRGNQDTDQTPVTIGAWIEAAGKVFDGSPGTFADYVRSLRFIASEIAGMSKDPKRFERRQSAEYRRRIDTFPLLILTPASIQSWRIKYVSEHGTDPARARSARITVNSTLRQAKSLFGKRIVKYVTIKLPDPIPFAGAEFFPRESMRYHSKIDPAELMSAASAELAETDPDAFLALVLALGAGLRRGEIDRLLWRQVDTVAGVIHVHVTEVGGLKSADSTGAVAIDPTLASVLQGFKARATGAYVIGGDDSEPENHAGWSRKYRCEATFDRLVDWLRGQGIKGQKPIHTLRKEAGSIIATEHGILAASRFLRHADIQVAARHYTDHKTRTTVDMSALMPPNVAELPPRAKKTG